jgi:hypothetical protein
LYGTNGHLAVLFAMGLLTVLLWGQASEQQDASPNESQSLWCRWDSHIASCNGPAWISPEMDLKRTTNKRFGRE